MKGTQMGFTDLALNTIGQTMDDAPVPILYIAPTRKLVESISRDRFKKMVRGCESLRQKIEEDGLDNLTEKFIGGAPLRFMWASSASELASHPACVIIIDERDRMSNNVAGEGDPVILAEARSSTYPDRLILIISTPTIEDVSPIEKLYKAGNKLSWSWPCPGCYEYFAPCYKRHKWPEGSTKESIKKSGSWVECPNPDCKHKIWNKDKEELNRQGIYLGPKQKAKLVDGKPVVTGELPETETLSVWISGLCSPWRPFDEVATEWLEACHEGDIEQIQGIMNTRYGELFKMPGESPSNEQIEELKLDYLSGTVHPGTVLLTCGMDVQKESIYYVVRAWGQYDESWLVEHGQIHGNTYDNETWKKATNLLSRRWKGQSGEFMISRCAIDSGYRTEVVYFWSKTNPIIMACDGRDRRVGTPISTSKQETYPDGSAIPGGLKLWAFFKHFFRSWIFGRMQRPKNQDGRWNLCKNVEDDYCQQITAEEMVPTPTGIIWRKKKEGLANHYFDAEVHARVAAHVMNVDLQIQRSQQAAVQKQGNLMKRRV